MMSFFGMDVRTSSASFESAGRRITVQQFHPASAGRYPAIIALHGSGGIREGWSEQPSKLMAGQGFSVFVVHYFERTGTAWADRDSTHRHFPEWMKAIGDAITFAGYNPSV